MLTVAVIDYDMGNLHSVCKGLEKAGVMAKITDSPAELERANAVVLPGVGSFDPAVQHLRSRNLEEPIKQIIASGKPFLGICLGLQICLKVAKKVPNQDSAFFPEWYVALNQNQGLQFLTWAGINYS